MPPQRGLAPARGPPRTPTDTLGAFPPDTLVAARAGDAPYRPARVLGLAEASGCESISSGAIAELRAERPGAAAGAVVRFCGKDGTEGDGVVVPVWRMALMPSGVGGPGLFEDGMGRWMWDVGFAEAEVEARMKWGEGEEEDTLRAFRCAEEKAVERGNGQQGFCVLKGAVEEADGPRRGELEIGTMVWVNFGCNSGMLAWPGWVTGLHDDLFGEMQTKAGDKAREAVMLISEVCDPDRPNEAVGTPILAPLADLLPFVRPALSSEGFVQPLRWGRFYEGWVVGKAAEEVSACAGVVQMPDWARRSEDQFVLSPKAALIWQNFHEAVEISKLCAEKLSLALALGKFGEISDVSGVEEGRGTEVSPASGDRSHCGDKSPGQANVQVDDAKSSSVVSNGSSANLDSADSPPESPESAAVLSVPGAEEAVEEDKSLAAKEIGVDRNEDHGVVSSGVAGGQKQTLASSTNLVSASAALPSSAARPPSSNLVKKKAKRRKVPDWARKSGRERKSKKRRHEDIDHEPDAEVDVMEALPILESEPEKVSSSSRCEAQLRSKVTAIDGERILLSKARLVQNKGRAAPDWRQCVKALMLEVAHALEIECVSLLLLHKFARAHWSTFFWHCPESDCSSGHSLLTSLHGAMKELAHGEGKCFNLSSVNGECSWSLECGLDHSVTKLLYARNGEVVRQQCSPLTSVGTVLPTRPSSPAPLKSSPPSPRAAKSSCKRMPASSLAIEMTRPSNRGSSVSDDNPCTVPAHFSAVSARMSSLRHPTATPRAVPRAAVRALIMSADDRSLQTIYHGTPSPHEIISLAKALMTCAPVPPRPVVKMTILSLPEGFYRLEFRDVLPTAQEVAFLSRVLQTSVSPSSSTFQSSCQAAVVTSLLMLPNPKTEVPAPCVYELLCGGSPSAVEIAVLLNELRCCEPLAPKSSAIPITTRSDGSLRLDFAVPPNTKELVYMLQELRGR